MRQQFQQIGRIQKLDRKRCFDWFASAERARQLLPNVEEILWTGGLPSSLDEVALHVISRYMQRPGIPDVCVRSQNE